MDVQRHAEARRLLQVSDGRTLRPPGEMEGSNLASGHYCCVVALR